MFGLSGPVSSGLITGFMQQGLRRDHMKAVAEAEAAAAAKKAEEERKLQKIKDDAADLRTLATTQATMQAARYRADASAHASHQKLQFEMIQSIPDLAEKGVFSLEAKDHFTRADDGTIIPITPWFKLYFNKKYPERSVSIFSQALKMQKDRKQEVNKWSNYPKSLQEHFLLQQSGKSESYYNHLVKKQKANRKLTPLEANYKAYVDETTKFNKGVKDNKQKKSILPFEYWFALNAKTTAGRTEKTRAKDTLNNYMKGSLPVSLIYVDYDTEKKIVHPSLIRTLAINDLLVGESVKELRNESRRHAKLFYNRQRQANQENTKVTGRMHITEIPGLHNLRTVIPNLPDSETVLQETYQGSKQLDFYSASDMLTRLQKLGLFGKPGDTEKKRIDNIKRSGTYQYILKLLNAMSKGVESVVDGQEITTYYNLNENLNKTLQVLTKIDSNLPKTHSRFFNQRNEVHYTDKATPQNGTVITKIAPGVLGTESSRTLNLSLHLEQKNPVFKRLSNVLKTEDNVGLSKEEVLEGYQYYFPTDQNPRVIDDEDTPYARSEKLVLENPFLTIISPYLSGFGNLLEHKSAMSTVQKRLKSIKYSKGTKDPKKIEFWKKRNKLKESQDDIFQLIDTTLTYVGSINDADIRDSSLDELISTLEENSWNVTTGIGSDLFQKVSDTLKGLVGVGDTYATEISSLRQQFSSKFLNNAKSVSNLVKTDIKFRDEAELIRTAREKERGGPNASEKVKRDADRRFALRSIILFNKVQLTYKLAGLVQGDQTGGRTISNQDFDTVWKHLWGRSDLSNLANLKALRTDINLRRKLGDAFDVVYEFEGEISGTLKRAANEVHHDQTKRWIKSRPEYKSQIDSYLNNNNNNNKDSLLKLNGLIGLGENDALKPMTIANGKIAGISYGPSVTSINNRMLESPKSELAVPNRFINSALLLSTLKDNPSNSGITPTSKQMRGSAYSLAITAGRIYGTPKILDPQFVLNDKVTRDNSIYPIFNPLKSEFYQRVINGDMNTFEQLLEHMKTIDFSNDNGDSDISRKTLNIEKEFLINLLEYTQRYFTRGAE
tara:strand:+ start:2640 stop:5831 length:3192 start_codon:yes stop_codon:yes gene_type:complete